MDLRTLIATIGFDERHILPSLRLLPYDRLVLVGGRNSFRSAGFRRLHALEPNLEVVRVTRSTSAIAWNPSKHGSERREPQVRSESARPAGRRSSPWPPSWRP